MQRDPAENAAVLAAFDAAKREFLGNASYAQIGIGFDAGVKFAEERLRGKSTIAIILDELECYEC